MNIKNVHIYSISVKDNAKKIGWRSKQSAEYRKNQLFTGTHSNYCIQNVKESIVKVEVERRFPDRDQED